MPAGGHERGTGTGGGSPVLLLAALLSAFLLPVAALAEDPPAATADAAPLAAMFHLAGAPFPEFPGSATEIRTAVFEALSALSGARGRLLADRARTEEIIRRHRIRTGSSLTPEFLAELRTETGAGTLLAVGLSAEDGSLAVGIRAIDTGTGRLTGIGQAEAVPTAADWRRTLTEILRRAYPDVAGTAVGGTPLLILPARAVGLDPQSARSATTCVLAEALAAGQWSILDPGLVAGAAAAAGRNLELLDADGRALLGDRCGVGWAVVPEVVSFAIANESGANRLPVEDDGGSRLRRVADLQLSLQLLDLRTGHVRTAVSTLIAGAPRVGWFGHVAQRTELEQLQDAASQLWSRLQRRFEEQDS